ncbi:MAG: endonuclease/exonuclease/phosphatase family protein [Chitinophagaceae bacterium]
MRFILLHLKRRKDPKSIRIATWNVARFIELAKNNNQGSHTRLRMMELIQQQNADVLCLQEFHTSTDPSYYNNIIAVKKLGYPYYYFSFDNDGDRHYYSSIIFSNNTQSLTAALSATHGLH